MATLRKRGSKWQVQIRTKGQQPLSRSFPTKTLALAWVEDQKDGRHVSKSTTLRSLLTAYAIETESEVSKAFIKSFTNRCSFLDKSLTKLTTNDFTIYREESLKTMKPSSYNRSIKPIVAAFKWAIEFKNYPKDCANCITETRLKAKVSKRRRRFMPHEETKFHLANSCPDLGAVVTVLVESAMRSGELLQAKKSYLRDGFIHLPASATKTKNPRTVALSPRALSAIEVLVASSASDRIVGANPASLKKKFRRVRDAAGLEDLHLHDLRHEGLSRMAESGFGPSELMSQSGHTNLAQLGDYLHADPNLIQRKLMLLSQSQQSLQTQEGHSICSIRPQHSKTAPQLLVAQPILEQVC